MRAGGLCPATSAAPGACAHTRTHTQKHILSKPSHHPNDALSLGILHWGVIPKRPSTVSVSDTKMWKQLASPLAIPHVFSPCSEYDHYSPGKNQPHHQTANADHFLSKCCLLSPKSPTEANSCEGSRRQRRLARLSVFTMEMAPVPCN